MRKHSAENERIKHDYFGYLKHAQRYSEASIDGAAKAIARFEAFTNYRDFKRFHIQQAIGFKRVLAESTQSAKGGALSLATQRSTLNHLRALFVWLAAQPGYKSRFSYADAEYFNMAEKENRAAQTRPARPFPSLEQAQHAIRSMPSGSPIEQRDRAIIAFSLLTGCRDRALVSLKLKHVDLEARRVNLDAREVQTKFSKSFETFFMPVGDDIAAMVVEWIRFLQTEHLWSPSDPLFPATSVEHDSQAGFRVAGLKREHWTTTNAIRRIFRSAFESAGLPYFNPHSFRHTLAQLGEQVCRSPEEFKAWSQNIGHEHVMTTFNSYGNVSSNRQGEIIRQLGAPNAPSQSELAELLSQTALALKRTPITR